MAVTKHLVEATKLCYQNDLVDVQPNRFGKHSLVETTKLLVSAISTKFFGRLNQFFGWANQTFSRQISEGKGKDQPTVYGEYDVR